MKKNVILVLVLLFTSSFSLTNVDAEPKEITYVVIFDEALYFNVPVIASDAVARSVLVHLYPVENSKKFVEVVEYVLQEKVYGVERKRNSMHQKYCYTICSMF